MARRGLVFTKAFVALGILLVITGIGLTIFMSQTASAAGSIGGGGSGGGSGSGWGWTTYGNGWALYNTGKNAPGPSAGINSGSWATANSSCSGFSQYVALYILGTGTDPRTGVAIPSGDYMGYAYNSGTTDGTLWGGGGSVDHGRATKISLTDARGHFFDLPNYGVDIYPKSKWQWNNNVAWFCYGVYPTKVTPNVTAAAGSITRGKPATFSLARTVSTFSAPDKTSKYIVSYAYSSSGPWRPIPTSVSTSYDNATPSTPLSLTISGNVTNKPVGPNLTFPGGFEPLSATSICVRMQFVLPIPAHVDYTGNPDIACTKITAPPATCDAVSSVSYSSGIPVQQGDSSALTFHVTSATPTNRAVSYTIKDSSGATIAGPSTVIINGGSKSSGATPAIPFPVAGTYTVTWWFVGGSPSGNCTDSFDVVVMPYFSVYGSSVRIGGDFAPADCSVGGELGGWYNNQPGNYYGSGTQLAAIALINIVGVASSQTATPTNPTALSFANTIPSDKSTNSDSPKLGGHFETRHCLPYPSVAPGPTTTSADPINLGGLTGTYNYQSTLSKTEVAGATIADGANITVVVKGDIYIQDNIFYDTMTPWMISGATSNIPSLKIIADGGDIYIANGVRQLDGLYVAKKDSSSGKGGTIHTCSTLSGSNFIAEPDAQKYANCTQPLVIHGAFVANQVNLQRTYGTLNDAGKAYGGATACQNHGAAAVPVYSSCAAEVFLFSPEMYLANPGTNGPAAPEYDSITSLPPVL